MATANQEALASEIGIKPDPQRYFGEIMLGRECWFCDKGEEIEALAYDSEFDTPVHISCIKAKLAENPEHPEARCMDYLLPKDENDLA